MTNEKRLIYADEALRMLKDSKQDNPFFNGKTAPIWEMAHDCARSCVEACRTVDAVEVVHCCDCKMCTAFQQYADSETMLTCTYHSFRLVDPTDYCSWGEGKNNG